MITTKKKIIPSIGWRVTEFCNYSCEYCTSKPVMTRHNWDHSSDKVVEDTLSYIEESEESWNVKLMGGEPLLHPRLEEICDRIIRSNSTMYITTNLSLPVEDLGRLIDICKDGLTTLSASLHLSQIDSIKGFVDRADFFNRNKSSETKFFVTSVVTNENFEQLVEIESLLNERGIELQYQLLKVEDENSKRYFDDYSDHVKDYIETRLQPHNRLAEEFSNRGCAGTLCYTGCYYFNIDSTGSVTRCVMEQEDGYMGSISDKDFKRFDSYKPCKASVCNCLIPYNRGMILFEKEPVNIYV
jgi:MoaA/NifB/PqqE/SkfB family radical SAM enzyme